MNQKLESLLELALDVSPQTREKSENLSAGFEFEDNTWEVILLYAGAVEELRQQYPDISLTSLLGGYVIVKVTEEQLQEISENPKVQFVEKPKILDFFINEGRQVSCIFPVQQNPYNLTGAGVIVAVIDSGLDIRHPDFRKEDGTTRVIGLWDQTRGEGEPPEGYSLGTYYTGEELNQRLIDGESLPGVDISGHGTHVTGIAAGNGRASNGVQRGIAYEADILFVKLAASQTANFMQAVDFCVRKGIELGRPLALNISYGNNYGSHQGTALFETYLNAVCDLGKTTICIGSGNEGNRRRHARVNLVENQEYTVEFTVALGEREISVQIWQTFGDEFGVTLLSPSGESVSYGVNSNGKYENTMGSTEIVWFFGMPAPYEKSREIYIVMVPAEENNVVQSGIWKLIFTPERIGYGEVYMWLPSGAGKSPDTGFLVPELSRTFTIPSTASKPITVGAYDGDRDVYASFSGQGEICCQWVKPDLVAPGVDILSCAPGGGYTRKSGTSMACPFVTGSAALLMQYGIVEGRDPFLYGEKIKAYLIKGARALPGGTVPSPEQGWGALCLEASF